MGRVVAARPLAARLRRLGEELEEIGLRPDAGDAVHRLVLEEIDAAMRPVAHERRVASSGVVVEPTTEPATWRERTQLDISRLPVVRRGRVAARRFADGLSSWLVCRRGGGDEWLMFDRPAGSERDLVVLSDVLGSVVVQRHPSGAVRVVGRFGVLRWQRLAWHREPPAATLVETASIGRPDSERAVLTALVEFALHDLGSQGIGALLIHRPRVGADDLEPRLPMPPPLCITTAFHLAPLRHALAQIDGAAVLDADGVVRELGVRIVPSPTAETTVDARGGTRHVAALRYSYDEPTATVVVVSEDGPVSIMRAGAVLAQSRRDAGPLG
jgi:DNA integrity scanning protein DisA with diadenylate cyclase activity